jgi:hypothetical protein
MAGAGKAAAAMDDCERCGTHRKASSRASLRLATWPDSTAMLSILPYSGMDASSSRHAVSGAAAAVLASAGWVWVWLRTWYTSSRSERATSRSGSSPCAAAGSRVK